MSNIFPRCVLVLYNAVISTGSARERKRFNARDSRTTIKAKGLRYELCTMAIYKGQNES